MKTIIRFRTIILLCAISLVIGLTLDAFRRNNQVDQTEWQPTEMFSENLRRFDSYQRLLHEEEQKRLPADQRTKLLTVEAVSTTKRDE